MTNRQKVVVLGANSFSGQDFVDLLLDDPTLQVIGVSRSAERSPTFLRYRQRSKLDQFRYVQLDMNREGAALRALLDDWKPEMIVNFAAQSEVAPSWDHPEHWFQTNTVALAELVNHLRMRKYLQRYLHISSPEVYGNCIGRITESAQMNPSTPYAASKASADMLLSTYQKQFGFPLVTVRATNVYGARQQLFKIIPRSVLYLKLDKSIELHGGGVAIKSYIHIRDVSRGEAAILRQGKIGELYHLSPDQGVSVRQVVETICEKMGKSFEKSVRMVDERPGQDATYIINSARARAELGWRPQISLKEGLEEVVDWVNTSWDQIKTVPLEYQHKA